MSNLNPQPSKYAAARAYCNWDRAVFTVGAKNTNTINVALQLQDSRAQTPLAICPVKVYLSANADGSTLTATATTSALAIGTNGVLLDITTTGKVCDIITNAAGQADLNIVQTAGGTTYYLVVVKPDGGIVTSPVISF
jgi:hypothetical protein